jgi:hypothetical protein
MHHQSVKKHGIALMLLLQKSLKKIPLKLAVPKREKPFICRCLMR